MTKLNPKSFDKKLTLQNHVFSESLYDYCYYYQIFNTELTPLPRSISKCTRSNFLQFLSYTFIIPNPKLTTLLFLTIFVLSSMKNHKRNIFLTNNRNVQAFLSPKISVFHNFTFKQTFK